MSEQQSAALSYATVSQIPSRGPRVWAAAIIMLTALGLIVVGGCFMIGIMIINDPHAAFGGGGGGGPPASMTLTTGDLILEVVLYVLSFGCFGGAIALMLLGIRWLRRVIQA